MEEAHKRNQLEAIKNHPEQLLSSNPEESAEKHELENNTLNLPEGA